jgi:[lysine-biosynthesis-protein LysW]--L-2-aminoadipate ligase
MEELAVKASKAMGGGILGIDMMEDEKKGLVVHMVKYALDYVRK